MDNCVARQGMALADMKNMSEENETLKATVKELLAEIKRLSDIVDNIYSAP
jgi:cell division protein FtsB